jgi:hypothetical protein
VAFPFGKDLYFYLIKESNNTRQIENMKKNVDKFVCKKTRIEGEYPNISTIPNFY